MIWTRHKSSMFFRREANRCAICYSQIDNDNRQDFGISRGKRRVCTYFRNGLPGFQSTCNQGLSLNSQRSETLMTHTGFIRGSFVSLNSYRIVQHISKIDTYSKFRSRPRVGNKHRFLEKWAKRINIGPKLKKNRLKKICKLMLKKKIQTWKIQNLINVSRPGKKSKINQLHLFRTIEFVVNRNGA